MPPARAATLVRHVEVKAHRRGWDETPQTLMAMRPTAGPDSPYRPVPIPVDWDNVESGPGVIGFGLMSMATDLLRGERASAQGRRLLADLRRHRFAGLAFLSEAWMRGMADEAAVEAYRDGKMPSLADMIDDGETKTQELRQVNAVDTSGTCYWLTRIRPGEPTLDVYDWNEPESITGNVASALRLLTIAVCDGLDGGEHDISGLAAYRDAILASPHDFRMPPAAFQATG